MKTFGGGSWKELKASIPLLAVLDEHANATQDRFIYSFRAPINHLTCIYVINFTCVEDDGKFPKTQVNELSARMSYSFIASLWVGSINLTVAFSPALIQNFLWHIERVLEALCRRSNWAIGTPGLSSFHHAIITKETESESNKTFPQRYQMDINRNINLTAHRAISKRKLKMI